MSVDVLSKLAEQAGLHDEWYIDNPEIEEFAKLIVRQCGQFTKDIINAGGIPAEHANALLLAHFGITE
jgi:hypothetical protein